MLEILNSIFITLEERKMVRKHLAMNNPKTEFTKNLASRAW